MAIDVDAFTTRYGYSPQRYVEKVAVAQALGARLAEFEASLAKAKTQLKPGWETAKTQEAMQAGASAETLVIDLELQVQAAKQHQAAALAFAKGGDFAVYSGNLGAQANQIISELGVDEDAVRAAINAAVA